LTEGKRLYNSGEQCYGVTNNISFNIVYSTIFLCSQFSFTTCFHCSTEI